MAVEGDGAAAGLVPVLRVAATLGCMVPSGIGADPGTRLCSWNSAELSIEVSSNPVGISSAIDNRYY